jgi:AmmeMemoRadiSam system protein B
VLRLPAVAGRFYPSNPRELAALVRQYTKAEPGTEINRVKACLVPHAGYVYSGHVAGAVFSRVALPQKILILGVRHFPRGEQAAILSSGAWRTPLGDAPIDEPLAQALRAACPLLREDRVAHSGEHSLEVQLPFLQVLAPGFTFVPVALGTIRLEDLVHVGEEVGRVLASWNEEVLLLTSRFPCAGWGRPLRCSRCYAPWTRSRPNWCGMRHRRTSREIRVRSLGMPV